jgi:hypothetical protein
LLVQSEKAAGLLDAGVTFKLGGLVGLLNLLEGVVLRTLLNLGILEVLDEAA